MKKLLILLCFFCACPALADEQDDAISNAKQVFEAVRITCSGISDEIRRVANISKANTAIAATGTVAAGGALVAGIKKSQEEEKIDQLVQEICSAGGCTPEGIESMSNEQFLESVIWRMAKISELQEKLDKSKQLGNWRTGLLAGTVVTNLASTILSGLNIDQSELIQHIVACNQAMEQIPKAEAALRSAGVGAMHNSIATQLNNTRTWCSPININDVEKIERRMKGVMGTSVAGTAVGAIGVGVSAAANSDKYTDITNRVMLDEKEAKKGRALNTTANIMAGTNVAVGAVETGLNISLITLTKKLINQAEYCEEVLNQ